MFSLLSMLLTTLLLWSSSLVAANLSTFQEPATQTDRVIVKFREAPSVRPGVKSFSAMAAQLEGLSTKAGVALRRARVMSGGAQVLQLPTAMPVAEVEELARRLALDPQVEYAEPDRLLRPMAVPNDAFYSSQWYLKDPVKDNIPGAANLPAAWDISKGSSAVVVAIIDTGILPHNDLAGRILPGYDFISLPFIANDGDGRDSDATDPGDWIDAGECGYTSSYRSDWHGTHIGGIIAAASNNGMGIAGVNWVSKILPVRVLGKCGGYESDLVDAMHWAVGLPLKDVPTNQGVPNNPNPAQVLNLSLGGVGACSTSAQAAIDAVTAAGATVVVAAGNGGVDAKLYSPGSCQGVITVAAANYAGGKAYYSNHGPLVDIAAPGGELFNGFAVEGIYSTFDSGAKTAANDSSYTFYDGTSMAAPVVSGVASLMLAANHALTGRYLKPDVLAQKLQASARVFPVKTNFLNTNDDCTTALCGAGLLDAKKALAAVTTAPLANAGSDIVAYTSQTVTLNASTSSDDGSIVGYAWAQLSGTAVTLTATAAAAPQFTAPDVTGELVFQVTVTDDVGLSATDTITVTVNPLLSATSSAFETLEDTPVSGTLTASTYKQVPLTFHIVADAAKGVVSLDAATGEFTYIPDPDAYGADSFMFRISDGVSSSASAVVNVTIKPVPDSPIARSATYNVTAGSSLDETLLGADLDGDPLTYSIVTPPAKGRVTLIDTATGTFQYLSLDKGQSTDSFVFAVSDTAHATAQATVTINIGASKSASQSTGIAAGSSSGGGGVSDILMLMLFGLLLGRVVFCRYK